MSSDGRVLVVAWAWRRDGVVAYSANTNLHPRLWPVNAVDLYNWSLQRSNVQVMAAYYATNGNQTLTTLAITNATDPNTGVELLLPASGALVLELEFNEVTRRTGKQGRSRESGVGNWDS